MSRMRGKCQQRLFTETTSHDVSEIRQLENELHKWQSEVNSRTRLVDNQVNFKLKEVKTLRESCQQTECEVVAITEENVILCQRGIKIKNESETIKYVSNRVKENNKHMSEIVNTEQELRQAELETIQNLDDKVNEACRPLQQLSTETERAFKLVQSKIDQLRNQKDERSFMQHLKLDEIKSAIEKNRHL